MKEGCCAILFFFLLEGWGPIVASTLHIGGTLKVWLWCVYAFLYAENKKGEGHKKIRKERT